MNSEMLQVSNSQNLFLLSTVNLYKFGEQSCLQQKLSKPKHSVEQVPKELQKRTQKETKLKESKAKPQSIWSLPRYPVAKATSNKSFNYIRASERNFYQQYKVYFGLHSKEEWGIWDKEYSNRGGGQNWDEEGDKEGWGIQQQVVLISLAQI